MDFEIKLMTNHNGKGFYFTDPYFYTLALLGLDGPFTQQQILDIFTLFGDIHEKSWSKKIVKLKNIKLLTQKKQNIRKRDGMLFNFVDITERGLDFLKFTGFVNKGITKRHTSFSDHTLGIRQVVVDILKVIAETKDLGEGYVTRNTLFKIQKKSMKTKPERFYKIHQDELDGNSHSIHLFRENKKEIQMAKTRYVTSHNPYTVKLVDGLIPDWIFQLRKDLFHIEIDSGKQSFETLIGEDGNEIEKGTQTTIKEKILKYIELAKVKPLFNHRAVFILLDDSVTTKKHFGNRSTRIRNLKENIGEVISREAPQNLEVFVISLERTKDFFKKMLLRALKEQETDSTIVTALEALNKSTEFPYIPTIVDNADFHSWDILVQNITTPTPYIFSLSSIKTEKKLYEHMLIPVVAMEGEVLSKYKMDQYVDMIENATFIKSKVLLIYQHRDSMEHDILQSIPKRNRMSNKYFKNILLMPLDEQRDGTIVNQNLYTLDMKSLDLVQLSEFLKTN
ncbi:hypothetical protein J2S09_004104 [Bacillus fengqiuensis]|nr:hypothetical protein [Bacillus fengqiuensis]